MELFRIVVMNSSERVACTLYDLMTEKLTHIDGLHTELKLDMQRFTTYTILTGELDYPLLPAMERQVFEQLSHSVADYIIGEQESDLIRSMIKNHPQLHHEQDEERVYEYAIQQMNDPAELDASLPYLAMHRRTDIVDTTNSYFLESHTLNIEGYILFRLKNYVDDIALLVENAIDEYRLEQQYQEFITLLKYFVYIQDVKISLVHVIHKSEHDFEIVDDQLQAVHFSKKDAFCKLEMIDHHVNVDDMLISTLVSVSPARICIHSQTPHTPVIEMIHQIFEDRVKLCTHCRTCQSYIGESKQ